MAADWKSIEVASDDAAMDPTWLDKLAAGDIPAIIFRQAYTPASCRALIDRLIERELLYDPELPVPDRFLATSVPEGYHREGAASATWTGAAEQGRIRIDVGSSLGYRGSDKEAFLAHSRQTHELFATLFDELVHPVDLLYRSLQSLSPQRRVVTAYEADGQLYGPAIIRAHYGGYTYKPHFDSVRLREQRHEYAVTQFEHQLAGVLVLQNSRLSGRTAQCILHRCLWQPEIDAHLKDGTFADYARQEKVDHLEVCLDPGDLYFFNTRCIHEVPGVAGPLPRIVLAAFVGYSPDCEEIFVWS